MAMTNRVIKCGPRETWSSGLAVGIDAKDNRVVFFKFCSTHEADMNVICVTEVSKNYTMNSYFLGKEVLPV